MFCIKMYYFFALGKKGIYLLIVLQWTPLPCDLVILAFNLFFSSIQKRGACADSVVVGFKVFMWDVYVDIKCDLQWPIIMDRKSVWRTR